jgi:hypothetical protein
MANIQENKLILRSLLHITALSDSLIREYELKISSGDYFRARSKLWSVRFIAGFSGG